MARKRAKGDLVAGAGARYHVALGAYSAGARAFRDGYGLDAVPYCGGDLRYSWFVGFLDARTGAFLDGQSGTGGAAETACTAASGRLKRR